MTLINAFRVPLQRLAPDIAICLLFGDCSPLYSSTDQSRSSSERCKLRDSASLNGTDHLLSCGSGHSPFGLLGPPRRLVTRVEDPSFRCTEWLRSYLRLSGRPNVDSADRHDRSLTASPGLGDKACSMRSPACQRYRLALRSVLYHQRLLRP